MAAGTKGPNKKRREIAKKAERRNAVVRLYLSSAGDQLSMEAIAERFDVSVSTVSRDVKQQREIWESQNLALRDDYVKQELVKLDMLETDAINYIRNQGEGMDDVVEGEEAAKFTNDPDRMEQFIKTMLNLQKRRAKLLGLDAPQRLELMGKDGNPVEVAFHAMSDKELETIAAGKTTHK